jgi:ELWxxDGT repeat protein
MRRLAVASILLILMLFLGHAQAVAQEPHLVKDINPGSGEGDPMYMTEMDGAFLFAATDSTHGRELWRSDGTEEGTWMVKDINPGSASSSPSNLVVFNGILFFRAEHAVHDYEVWLEGVLAEKCQPLRDLLVSPNSPRGLSILSDGSSNR